MTDKKTAPKATEKSQQLHSVQLLKDHTHAGERCRAGSTIDVTIADKNWLRAQRIIADDQPAPAAE